MEVSKRKGDVGRDKVRMIHSLKNRGCENRRLQLVCRKLPTTVAMISSDFVLNLPFVLQLCFFTSIICFLFAVNSQPKIRRNHTYCDCPKPSGTLESLELNSTRMSISTDMFIVWLLTVVFKTLPSARRRVRTMK